MSKKYSYPFYIVITVENGALLLGHAVVSGKKIFRSPWQAFARNLIVKRLKLENRAFNTVLYLEGPFKVCKCTSTGLPFGAPSFVMYMYNVLPISNRK